jgi:hypothetical protein
LTHTIREPLGRVSSGHFVVTEGEVKFGAWVRDFVNVELRTGQGIASAMGLAYDVDLIGCRFTCIDRLQPFALDSFIVTCDTPYLL